jgi:hypothetical protein
MRYIVRLRGKFHKAIEGYFRNNGIEITYYDKVLDDTVIVKTDKTVEELNDMQYVFEAKPVRTDGKLLLENGSEIEFIESGRVTRGRGVKYYFK